MLRTGALLASGKVRVQLVEEKHGERVLVGYRFREDAPLPEDVNNLRFNFSPCFARVGNQFLVSSTLELGRELIGLLEKEASGPARTGSESPAVTQFYAAGGVALLRTFEDELFAQTVLTQAAPPEVAREQVRAFIDLVQQLGDVRVETNYGARDFRLDVVYTPAGTSR
jgi:hypothetical protein